MAVNWKRHFVRIFLVVVQLADKIASAFGYKIFKVSLASILGGQPADVVKEAQHPDIVRPLSLMLDGLQKDTQLSVVGRLILIGALRRMLLHRTEVRKALAQNPDILKAGVRRPIFIIGFPRTGTTMLYNLLAQDPQFFCPMMYEMVKPYPPGRPDNWRESERFLHDKKDIEVGLMMISKEYDIAHVMRPDHPEECIVALVRRFFINHYFLRIAALTGLADWYYNLRHEEIADIYRYYKTELQMIGYKGLEKQTYLLKAHVHLMDLDALLDVFPDACLLFTYRPLTEVIPSTCSVISRGTAGYGPIDANYGKRVNRMIAECANRGVATMKRYENMPQQKQPFRDIYYQDLVKDPIAVIKGIYKQYGFTYSAETEERQRAWLAANPQHKHGKHKYSMQQYGLTEADITGSYGPYLEYYQKTGQRLI